MSAAAKHRSSTDSFSHDERLRRLNGAMDYLDAHLAQPLNVKTLAAHSYFSVRHFTQVFLETLGETPGDYQRRIRLERAAFLLYIWRSASVAEIAYAVGFQSQAVFARAFRAHFDRSAKQWRSAFPGPVLTPEPWETFDKHPGALRDIKIEMLPPRKIAYMRAQGYCRQVLRALRAKLRRWAQARGLAAPGATFIDPVWCDVPGITPPRQWRYDAAVVVPTDFTPDRHVNVRELPGGPYVTAQYTGRYADDMAAHHSLYNCWMTERDCVLSGGQTFGMWRLAELSGDVEVARDSVVSYTACVPLLAVSKDLQR
jgi:AraC family transcriptional regulator